jgi:hypothetical protein
MKKMFASSVCMLSLCTVSMAGQANAAELLDVKPVTSGSAVTFEVTADIPMTYTYYKVPGQARAVVDIADADPEKVEPLIVVNKGAVASISVDKAMISDMTVSRLVFNLVSETDVDVTHSSDRKKLTVSFGGGKSIVASAPPVAAPVVVEEPVIAPPPAPKKELEPVVAVSKPEAKIVEEDPLGLDEPQPVVPPASAPLTKTAVAESTAAATIANPLSKDEEVSTGAYDSKSAVSGSVKLVPVVPVSSDQPIQNAVVKGIIVGSSFIEIQANGSVDRIKHMKLVQPDRLVVDIPGMSTIAVKSITVNKFGISKVRIGKNPGSVRIVLDSTKTPFPAYTVTTTDNGVQINFK